MKLKNMAYLYHICREADKGNLSKGYIGVSVKPTVRMRSHRCSKQNPNLNNALDKYDDIDIYGVIYTTEKKCYILENMLRPARNIGWNIAIGGSKPPSAKGTDRCISKITKRRVDYTHSKETKLIMSKAQQKHRQFHSDRMKGSLNPSYGLFGGMNVNFKGYYVTPIACYFSSEFASKTEGISKAAIHRRCKVGGIIKKNRWIEKKFYGQTWESLGWYFIEKGKTSSESNS